MHADNQTLFFNSTGHPGIAKSLTFLFRKKRGYNNWSRPENLGYPINTIDDEGSMIVAADGKSAYYASDRMDTKGGLDIYTFELREDLRPAKTLWVKGKVYDAKTKSGIPSSVELIDLSTKNLVSKLQTDEEGNYLITLPVGKSYAFNVNRKGYLFYSENFRLKADIADSFYIADIGLEPISLNASILLKNIFFDSKQTAINPDSQSELDKLVQLLNDNPKLRIEIRGHTDNIGQPADNLKLSTGRALSVVNYLLEKGIASPRLTYKGFGETKPISTNDTEDGRARNRRTELSVTRID